MRPLATTLLIALALAGCGGEDEPRAQSDPTPAPSAAAPTPTPTPAATQPPGRALRFRAKDGTRLRGRLTPAADTPAPALVLVHQLNGGPDQWDPLIPALHEAGFTTLAYASRDPRQPDESVLARDVAGAVRALRADPRVGRVGLVGASIGATTVAYVLGSRPDLDLFGGVGLSAVSSFGFSDLDRFRPRGLLLISDEQERYEIDNIQMDVSGGEEIPAYVARADGHGVELLDDPGVVRRLVDWLSARA